MYRRYKLLTWFVLCRVFTHTVCLYGTVQIQLNTILPLAGKYVFCTGCKFMIIGLHTCTYDVITASSVVRT